MGDGQYFEGAFEALTGRRPFGWQRRLFADHFARFAPGQHELPSALDIPTGLGKTSVMVVWLLALAFQAERQSVSLPRRLVYVVDRRTVVDQATDVAEGLRRRLRAALDKAEAGAEGDEVIARWQAGERAAAKRIADALLGLCLDCEDEASPLAISTLRGERADNREWQTDPARPAIIIGTVDMIGSRLLFSGYGVTRRMRPFHAGLLGQDTLLVHDEAHLSEPFGKLIRDIAAREREQKAPRPLHIMELSATQRERIRDDTPFALTEEDKTEAEIAKRLRATKRLFPPKEPTDEDSAIDKVVKLALQDKNERKRVLVYVRSPRDARRIADELAKATSRVALLTGTVRGYERDKLVKEPPFSGFRTDPDRTPPEATEYLVATSAGEVGVDLDADHMVCDLSTLDSMIQRLGRVNRLGGREAEIHVVEWPRKERKGEKEGEVEDRIAATKAALASLPKCDGAHDASPESLRALADRTDAFAQIPRTVPLTDILIDNWSLTRVKDLPGRPMPERWLHGIEGGEPDLHVAWREEVSLVAGCAKSVLKRLYDKHPILARERLRGPLRDVKEELKRLAKRKPKAGESKQGKPESEPPQPIQAILLPVDGDPIVGALADLLEREAALPNATIVLPPDAGGLDARGMLVGEAPYEPERTRYDVADDVNSDATEERRRLRILLERKEGEGWNARILGEAVDIPQELAEAIAEARTDRVPNRLVRDHFAKTFSLAEKALLVLDRDEEGEPRAALQLLSANRSAATAQDDPAAAARWQELAEHLSWTGDEAKKIVTRTELKTVSPAIADAVVIAARWHDRGKDRREWQAAIGHAPPRGGTDPSWKPWAKSGRNGFDESICPGYRHEFGSLREAAEDETIRSHPERDLILHLIAAHHGWARPHFEPDQWDIADGVTEEENAAVAAETMRRFARLQRRFGHWGLAWLESLMRAADYAATRRLTQEGAAAGAGERVS